MSVCIQWIFTFSIDSSTNEIGERSKIRKPHRRKQYVQLSYLWRHTWIPTVPTTQYPAAAAATAHWINGIYHASTFCLVIWCYVIWWLGDYHTYGAHEFHTLLYAHSEFISEWQRNAYTRNYYWLEAKTNTYTDGKFREHEVSAMRIFGRALSFSPCAHSQTNDLIHAQLSLFAQCKEGLREFWVLPDHSSVTIECQIQ